MLTEDKPSEMEVIARKSQHEGHDPTDPRTVLVEDLAAKICDYCAHGDLRWRDPDDTAVFAHNEEFGCDAHECDASHLLRAAVELGVPIYTGANLEIAPRD